MQNSGSDAGAHIQLKGIKSAHMRSCSQFKPCAHLVSTHSCTRTWFVCTQFNPCAHVVLIRTCAYITANKGKQGVPWEALAALYNVM